MTYYCNQIGYIIYRLLLAYGDDAKIHQTMLETAWIAQWIPFGKGKIIFLIIFYIIIIHDTFIVQDKYLKRSFKTIIICNPNIVGMCFSKSDNHND